MAALNQARPSRVMDKYQIPQRQGTWSWRDSKWAETLDFLGSFLRRPGTIGALAPSSRSLALTMIQGLELRRANAVVELGAGTGAFTGPISERVGKQTVFFALEIEDASVQVLRRRFPRVTVYPDSAERIPDYLARHGKARADYIISGLPWATLPESVQERIWNAVVSTLAPEGVFVTFSYFHARWLPRGRRFRQRLHQHFRRVEISPMVWANLPPAFVYRCSQRI